MGIIRDGPFECRFVTFTGYNLNTAYGLHGKNLRIRIEDLYTSFVGSKASKNEQNSYFV